MDPKQITKQFITFHKDVFDNMFDALAVRQARTEALMIVWMEQNQQFPAEEKAAITDWLTAYRKGCATFKTSVDDTQKKAEEIFGEFERGKKGWTLGAR